MNNFFDDTFGDLLTKDPNELLEEIKTKLNEILLRLEGISLVNRVSSDLVEKKIKSLKELIAQF